jgi:hypothetical protein
MNGETKLHRVVFSYCIQNQRYSCHFKHLSQLHTAPPTPGRRKNRYLHTACKSFKPPRLPAYLPTHKPQQTACLRFYTLYFAAALHKTHGIPKLSSMNL